MKSVVEHYTCDGKNWVLLRINEKSHAVMSEEVAFFVHKRLGEVLRELEGKRLKHMLDHFESLANGYQQEIAE